MWASSATRLRPMSGSTGFGPTPDEPAPGSDPPLGTRSVAHGRERQPPAQAEGRDPEREAGSHCCGGGGPERARARRERLERSAAGVRSGFFGAGPRPSTAAGARVRARSEEDLEGERSPRKDRAPPGWKRPGCVTDPTAEKRLGAALERALRVGHAPAMQPGPPAEWWRSSLATEAVPSHRAGRRGTAGRQRPQRWGAAAVGGNPSRGTKHVAGKVSALPLASWFARIR